eukprot:79879_1
MADEIVFIMPERHILSYDQFKSLVENDLASISNIGVTIRFKWPLEIPQLNRHRINEYLHDLYVLNWTRVFSADSISFKSNHQSLVPSSAIVPPERFERNMIADDTQLTLSKSMTRFKISGTARTSNALSSVCMFIGGALRVANHTDINVPTSILELVLSFYAVRLNIRYQNQIKQFLCCPVTDSLDSLSLKRIICVSFELSPSLADARFRFKHKERYVIVRWQEIRILELEIDRIVWVDPSAFKCVLYQDIEFEWKHISEPHFLDYKQFIYVVSAIIDRLNRDY